jgi:uncharacterized protein YeaO (DUF488 family)
MNINIKRIYDEPSKDDGIRVLVDRLWPRGISKEKAHIDKWLKEIGPSDELRKWFGHKDENWEAFRIKYLNELKANKTAVKELKEITKINRVTLLFAAKDKDKNNAKVLKDFLK